ncbi:helix-turn-helix transcriptional regulator [Streptomyces europaeiscabiei]|uniref:helix-turn-helix domain-containing protein n=1 Tax=Streptomyces europaeiscabiei TaxID=146819 RepID=UPI002E2716DB|nr:helix-turn-helix domain-containing protein [Streptomyces europaeiscabiei]
MQELPDDDAWIAAHRRAVGDRVRAERLHQNLTQEKLYLAARVDRVTLQRVEAGEDVRLSTLLKIARALGVPLADLLVDGPAAATGDVDGGP